MNTGKTNWAASPRYVCGLDLGQSQDFTALCVLEAHGDGDHAEYHLRYLKRWELMTSYTAIVSDLELMFRRVPFTTSRARLAVDVTGVGRAVWDMLRKARLNAHLHAITIHGGDVVTHQNGGYRTPKRDLVSAVQVTLQTSRLKIAASLEEADALTTELKNFRIKISATGHDTYGNMAGDGGLIWRETPHDDLVLALACALWLDRRAGVTFGKTVGISS